MDAKIARYELVELTVPASSTGKINFGNIPQLRNQANQFIIIQGIEVFSINAYANSQVTTNVSGMPDTEIPKLVLVLYVDGEESIHYIPLAKLIHDNASTVHYEFINEQFDNLWNVDLDKSYIQLNAASAGTIYVIPFGFKYLRAKTNPNAGQAGQPQFLKG